MVCSKRHPGSPRDLRRGRSWRLPTSGTPASRPASTTARIFAVRFEILQRNADSPRRNRRLPAGSRPSVLRGHRPLRPLSRPAPSPQPLARSHRTPLDAAVTGTETAHAMRAVDSAISSRPRRSPSGSRARRQCGARSGYRRKAAVLEDPRAHGIPGIGRRATSLHGATAQSSALAPTPLSLKIAPLPSRAQP